MAADGINALRTYVPPPRWLLDAALEHGIAGDGRLRLGAARRLPRRPGAGAADRERGSRDEVRACERHPAILCYSIGNEIPAPIVRWHGKRRGRALPRAPATGRPKRRTPRASSPTSTTPRPSTSSCPSSTSAAFNVFLEQERDLRVLPGAAAEPRRRPAAADHRARARQPPQRRRGAGAGARVAGPPRLRHRRRRHLRLRLDRRVAPRRPRGRSTGTSAWSTASGEPKPALAAVSRAFADVPVRRRRPLAARSRSSSAPTTAARRCDECLARLAALDLSRLRGDRRQRRLQRRPARRSPAPTAPT